MMKRMLSLLLVLALLLGLAGAAQADTEFETKLLNGLDRDIDTYYGNAKARALFAVVLLVDYASSTKNELNFAFNEPMYLQRYSDTALYFYVADQGGGYYEFYYFKGSAHTAASYTYYKSFTAEGVKNMLSGQQGSFEQIPKSDFVEALEGLQEAVKK